MSTQKPQDEQSRQHLTPEEVAADLRISVDTLRRKRERGEGPPWIQVSEKSFRYPKDLYLQWKRANLNLGDLENGNDEA